MMMSYYKSARADKSSDYEDIWEKSPVLSDLPPVISPTISEHRFKRFLFDKVFDKSTPADSSESHLETEPETNEDNDDDDEDLLLTSDPSYPTCSSSENISSSDNDLCHNTSSSISSYSTDSSDICDDLENTEDLTDPLAALENLTDYDTENDLEDFDDCDTDIKEDDADTLPMFDNDTSEKKEVISNATEESGEKQALSDNSVNDEQSCKISTSGSLTGLLRKLSIRRKPSFTRSWSRSRQAEKRLSAVIGCYLTPDLLGMTNEECQIDSSSWEFLDQSKEPGMEYFLQSGGVRQRTPSPAKPDIISDDSTLDSLYHSDESDQLLESIDQNKPVLPRSVRGSVTKSHSMRSSVTNVRLSSSTVTQCIMGRSTPPNFPQCNTGRTTPSTFPQCNVRVNDPDPQKQESVTHSRSHSSASSSILRNSLSDLVTKNSTSSVSGQASDSPEEVSAKRYPQKSVTLTEERHRRSDTAGAAMIKSYLRQLSSSETSVLGQIVR